MLDVLQIMYCMQLHRDSHIMYCTMYCKGCTFCIHCSAYSCAVQPMYCVSCKHVHECLQYIICTATRTVSLLLLVMH